MCYSHPVLCQNHCSIQHSSLIQQARTQNQQRILGWIFLFILELALRTHRILKRSDGKFYLHLVGNLSQQFLRQFLQQFLPCYFCLTSFSFLKLSFVLMWYTMIRRVQKQGWVNDTHVHTLLPTPKSVYITATS